MGWGPTIVEINYLSKLFSKVVHIAPLHKVDAPKSSLKYNENIEFIDLKPSGGKGIQKISILFTIPFNLRQIKKHTKDANYIQFRAPTGIGIYVLPWLHFMNNKPYWVKYAGNWVAEDAPLGNRLQRWWLKKIISAKTIVTVNGEWANQRQNIKSFENPCLTEENRIEGEKIIVAKKLTNKINYCFVGGLNENKGIKELIAIFSILNNKGIGILHVVGNGALLDELKVLAKKSKHSILFYGFMPKNKIQAIYKSCHFIVLPSKSEGFPKVIGEAMNFGCIPIVSNVSCIGQYIKNEYNGFLIDPNDKIDLKLTIEKSLLVSSDDFKKIREINYQLAEKFTYDYFLNRIQREIIDKV